MARNITDKDREQIAEVSVRLGSLLIRMGRHYLAAVRAPSREENSQAEDRFCDALGDFIIACGESGILD